MSVAPKPVLDPLHDCLGFGCAAMCGQPAGTLRKPHAHEEYCDAQGGTDGECNTPADVHWQNGLVEEHDGSDSTQGGADQEAAVDGKVGPPAYACRHQLLDRRIDGCVLSADARAGQEPE